MLLQLYYVGNWVTGGLAGVDVSQFTREIESGVSFQDNAPGKRAAEL